MLPLREWRQLVSVCNLCRLCRISRHRRTFKQRDGSPQLNNIMAASRKRCAYLLRVVEQQFQCCFVAGIALHEPNKLWLEAADGNQAVKILVFGNEYEAVLRGVIANGHVRCAGEAERLDLRGAGICGF